jgi:hypothetical protein
MALTEQELVDPEQLICWPEGQSRVTVQPSLYSPVIQGPSSHPLEPRPSVDRLGVEIVGLLRRKYGGR